MRQTQTTSTTSRLNARRRHNTASGLTFGQLGTTLAVAVILILLGVTFLGDYLRVPNLTVTTFPTIISPNDDQTQDTTSLSYALTEEANVLVEVLNENGVTVKTLDVVEKQLPGQYVVIWDGTDSDQLVVNDGRYVLQVTAAGPSRAAIQSAEVQVDLAPPSLRLTNLDDINRVSASGIVIEGLTEPGVRVYQAGNAQIINVDAQGRFQIERQLTEGVNILEIIASDLAGNTTHTSHEVALITAPPELSIASPANDQWFNESVLAIKGVAPEAAGVTINNQPVVLEEDGSFNHELILQEGDNTLRVEATDDVGNVTVRERLIHLKTKAPVLALSIDDGTVFQQSTIQLTGRTDPGSTVLVNNELVAVSPLGEFQQRINLVNGANTINVETRDIAGNITNLNRRVTFQSPVAESEVSRFFNNFPSLSSLGTPLLIVIPSLLLLGYLFTRPVSLMLTSDTENFAPGLPDEGQVITLMMDLSKSARTTVEIRNQFNRPVAVITHRRQRGAGEHTFHWDGYDDTGHVLPPGDYTIYAEASTPAGTVSSAVPIHLHEDPLVHGQYARKTQPVTVESQPEVVRRSTRRGRR